MSAWFKEKVARFANLDSEDVVRRLATRNIDENLEVLRSQQDSWRHTIDGLIELSRGWLEEHQDSADWTILLEYQLPRRSRRIDAVILARDIVVLIEFKDGASTFERADRWQAEQYALDVRDFHLSSRGREIVPFLVATNADQSARIPDYSLEESNSSDGRAHLLSLTNFPGLQQGVLKAFKRLSQTSNPPIDSDEWDDSPYMPSPWIVQAAREIFQKQDVREIKSAGSKNLDQTVEGVVELVNRCRDESKYGIAFITGAPGSGKTLAGLQVVHSESLADDKGEPAGIFLSGNQPLVSVIQSAIAADYSGHSGRDISKAESKRRVETFIQHAYQFRNDYAYNEEAVPPEHVILFDEAQRAWDAKQLTTWSRRGGSTVQNPKSEPDLFLNIMARAPKWSVIIAVVGSGQEINTGEAGLGEWGRAIMKSGTDWIVKASPHVLPGNATMVGDPLVKNRDELKNLTEDPRLHLEMNVRSPRAESLNQWVDSLIALDLPEARRNFSGMGDFPIALTRDLDVAKAWLLDRTDEDHRCGLVASGHARRLRAWGLNVGVLKAEKGWANWFLTRRGDIRSSDQLEIPANTFDCQGLELDWVGMCWGSDLILENGRQWSTRHLSGNRWRNARGEQRKFLLNCYRVLLTRARKGMVIWVPAVKEKWMLTDPTLDPNALDEIADILMESGVPLA